MKNKRLKYAALFIIGGLLTLAGCDSQKNKSTTNEPLTPSTKIEDGHITPPVTDSLKQPIGEKAPPMSMKTYPDSPSKIVTPYPNKKIKKKIKTDF